MIAAALGLATSRACAADTVSFNLGLSYSILGTTNSPSVPVALQVLLESAPMVDTFIALSSSNASVVTVPAGITVVAGQTSAVLSFTAYSLGIADVTATLGTSTAHTFVEAVVSLPAVPEPPAAFLLAAGLSALAIVRRQARRRRA